MLVKVNPAIAEEKKDSQRNYQKEQDRNCGPIKWNRNLNKIKGLVTLGAFKKRGGIVKSKNELLALNSKVLQLMEYDEVLDDLNKLNLKITKDLWNLVRGNISLLKNA